MKPDPTRHEASRPAFEAPYSTDLCKRSKRGKYMLRTIHAEWITWCRALDWRDAQVCGWKECEKDFLNETGCNRTIAYLKSDLIDFPFCPACGRRVKIQDSEQQITPNQ